MRDDGIAETRYTRGPSSQWDFYSLLLKIGLPALAFIVLFFLARTGDPLAIAMLVVVGAMIFLVLGVGATLLVIDRLHKAEQLRFAQNVRENMRLMEQTQRLQILQGRSLVGENRELRRQLPTADAGGLDVSTLEWDLLEIDRGA